METKEHYKQLKELEQETSKMRYTTFTALISISFILPGLSLKADAAQVIITDYAITLDKLVFLLGFLFYCFSVFHYAWYHRYSHIYRKKLKDLETQLDIEVYKLRARPQIGNMKMHFDWSLYIIGTVYGFITIVFIGWQLFAVTISSILLIYFMLMLRSRTKPTEPLE